MKRIYLVAGIIVLLILAFAAIADRTMIEQWPYSVLSYCLNLKAPSHLVAVKVVKGQEAINVQLSNATASSLKNVKVRIYIPESNSISFKNDEITSLNLSLASDDIQVFKPGQVNAYNIDPKKLNGADPDKIRIFVAGYYKYVLQLTHFGTDGPLGSFPEQ
jgi:hypothetical protein